MAVVPDPRKLFLPDPLAKDSVLRHTFGTFFLAGFGLTAVLGARYMAKRPLLSGIQHHVLAVVLGGAIGKYAQDKFDQHNADKDAVFRHYIDLHPQDFPMPARIKVGDKFESWTPIR